MRRVGIPLLALALAAAPAARAQITARPADGTLTALVNQALDVPVVVDMTAHPALLGAFAMRLTWNPAVLQYQAAMPGNFGAVTAGVDSVAQGILLLAGANPAGVGGGPVTVAVGRFVPLVADTTTLGLAVSQLFAAGTFASLLPALTTSPAFFCPAFGRYGDVDGDGNANSRDALIALSNAVGLNVSQFNVALGDVDADGNTNARDALIILSAAVGIDVSGYRVLAVSGGACSSGAPVTLAVAPGVTGDLLPGQQVQFEARATDVGGVLQPVTNVAWLTTDPAVMGILANGLAVARDTGTVDVIAVRDGRDTAFATVRVVARRTLHVVDATAAGATNRLGTPLLPYATVAEATGFLQDGDTIQVRVGRYTDMAFIERAVVIRGDTLPNGTRPLFTGGGVAAPVAFTLSSPGTVRIEQLDFADIPAAVNAVGGGRLELEGLRTSRVQNAVYVQRDQAALIIRNSRLSGDGQSGSGIAVFARVDTVHVEDSDVGDFGNSGLLLMRFGRLELLRTTFRDMYDGVTAGDGNAASPSGDVAVTDSRFLRLVSDGLHLQAVGNATIRGSRFELLEYDPAVSVSDARTVQLAADTFITLQSGGSYWVDVDRADSLLLDSIQANLLDADGYTYDVGYVRLTRSTFQNLTYGTPLSVSFGGQVTPGGHVVVDSVTVVGASSCQRCGYGVRVSGARLTVDRLNTVNVGAPLDVTTDSAVSVTRSRFQGAYRPISLQPSTPGLATLSVSQSTFRDWSDEAISAQDVGLVADSNTFDGGYTAILRQNGSRIPVPLTLTRNRIANVNAGINAEFRGGNGTGTVTDNVLTAVQGTGIQLSGDMNPDTIQVRFDVLRNAVTCTANGTPLGIQTDAANALVTDNVVACGSGITVSASSYGSAAVRWDSVLRNTVTLGFNGSGVTLYDNLRSLVSGNLVTGDTSLTSGAGGIALQQYNCSPCVGVAVVDSNVVQRTGGPGIRVQGIDSATITRNQVLDAVIRTGSGAIDLDGAYIGSHVRVAGNEVRRTREYYAGGGFGVYAYNYGSGTVDVDSNLVSDNTRGMYLDTYYGAPLAVTRNRIRRSVAEGVQVGNSGASLAFTQNNFFQNGFGMRSWTSVAAPDNWWNDPNGPACPVGAGCAGGAGADSVDASVVSYTPFATSEFTFTPPNAAPPAIRPAPGLAAVRAVPPAAGPALRAPAGTPAERLASARAASAARDARHAAHRAAQAAEHERRLQAARERRP